MKKKIRLLVNLVDFNTKYQGGINTFTTGLLSELKLNKKITILTTKTKLNSIKKIFNNKKFKYITIKDKNTFTKFLRFLSIILNSTIIYKISVKLEYLEILNLMNIGYDVLYCPLTNLRPLNLKIKTITSIHDIQHYNLPQNFSFFEKRYRNLLHTTTINYSSKIQVSSKFIYNNIAKYFSKKFSKKLFIISEGVSQNFVNSNKKLGNYLFFPAQLWPHKNHLTILKATKILNDKYKKKIKIILVGQKYNKSLPILNFINQNKELDIEYLGKVSSKKLKKLYINCKIVICPALYESSSLTLLEAIKMSKPVIASDTPPNIELNNYFKINFFKRDDPFLCAKLINQVWDNNILLNKQISFNKKRIGLFDWKEISKKYKIEFSKILS
jgi:glycosyltransferase involved in cell wall biosynthesis